ncbi:MAG: hypothetical protein A4E65_02971 [Syntrophorhabdus sp. PtaU1.Bin153]|nr:MAG: hypothetical protein A4E65_02971 [Syntrophorhabdus sp. PtaU1.Bin153]
MRILIVNADDLGADSARNRGIFEAIEAGRVTSVSVLVNGGASRDGIRRLVSYDRPLSVGIHINLSEGRPVSSGLRRLTGPDGAFLGKWFCHRLLEWQDDKNLEAEIRQELSAQIEFLIRTGLSVTHLDGHQHVHVFPAVIGPAIETARGYGIPWVRIPEEHDIPTGQGEKDGGETAEVATFAKFGAAARAFLDTSGGIRATDHFRGLRLKGRLSMGVVDELLDNLPDGTTELMVHPGRAATDRAASPFSAFSTDERERELCTLLDPEFPRLLEKYDITLTRFSEAELQ